MPTLSDLGLELPAVHPALSRWDLPDPFELAAQRTRQSVRPVGGRQEGWLTANPDFGLLYPRTPADAALMLALGPAGKYLGPALRTGAAAAGLTLQSDEAQAGPLSAAKKALQRVLTAAEKRAALPDAPFPQYAEQYPPVGPGTPMPKDKPKFEGETYLAKTLTPEATEFKKAREQINRQMQKEGYTPYFDPAERFPVDVKNYPPNVDTTTVLPKKQATIDRHLEKIGAEEVRQRLREAVAKGEQLGDADHWYWMGQLEADLRKQLGAKAGREAFKQNFATAMAATTGGSSPQSNLLTAAYGNYLRARGLPYPTESYQMPYPISGGKHGMTNVEAHQKFFDQGGWKALGAANEKRHDFAWGFMGGNAPVIDEQMTKLMTPNYGSISNKGISPYENTYSLYSRVMREEAAKAGRSPEDYQGLGWFGFKNQEGKPMIDVVNDTIERTHRLTGMPRDEIVRRGLGLGEIPLYAIGGGVLAGPTLRDLGQR